MKLRKVGSEESFSFLIGILIMIMILTPIIIIAYRMYAEKQGIEKCFNDLVTTAEGLKNGEQKEIICKFSKDYVLMGFDYNQQKLASTHAKSTVRLSWSSPIKSEVLSYARPDKVCPQLDQACLCLCQDNLNIAESKKCSGKLKCAQFPGIANIQGIFYGKAKSRSGNLLAKPMELGVRLGEAYFPVEFLGNSKDFLVVDADMVLGVLIQKQGDTLDFCNPTLVQGKRGCQYQDTSKGYEYVKMVNDCKLLKADKCKCGDFYMKSEPPTDPVIGQEDDATVIGTFSTDTEELNVKWYPKTDLCVYSTVEGKKDITYFSSQQIGIPGKYLDQNGYISLVSVGGQVCIAKQGDPLLSNIMDCKDKKTSTAPTPAPAANPNQQTTASQTNTSVALR